ncbi:AhpC/TSA antioxidant enzyme-domain-containing protein [Aspergillus egyptiacus]|nr:AhpC/TSA antioxidant enzyme-domain-containing protein [Aspergillus egyptiacus]
MSTKRSLRNDELSSAETLQKAARHTVFDREGRELPFETLYSGPNAAHRTLIVFVRHFFCGSCQEYLRTMKETITPDYLSCLPVSTSVAVVGCGESGLIDHYARETGCPYPIYCDPSRKLYDDLGMINTWEIGSSPAYVRKSLTRIILDSLWQMVKLLPSGLVLSGGPGAQVGGEFLFERSGHGGQTRVTWCHRMERAWGHTEVPVVTEILSRRMTSQGDDRDGK